MAPPKSVKTLARYKNVKMPPGDNRGKLAMAAQSAPSDRRQERDAQALRFAKPPASTPDEPRFTPQSKEQHEKGLAAAASDKKRGEAPNFHGVKHAEHVEKSNAHMDKAMEARRVGNDTGYQNHMDAAASHDQASWAHRENYHGEGGKLHAKAKEASADANKVSAAIETGSRGGTFVRTASGGKRYTKG